MASGHLCINLSEKVSWEDFPSFAAALLERIGGTRVGTMDAVDARLWDIVIDEHRVILVFDDFPAMVSLEARDREGDDVLRRVHARLKEK
ncbi:DUF3630 family protein [Pendulispora albinea]|uniref:DUF3630 family protein n=1 Tax=Pendulispora albinea TaxID=2741071 RepID=A0ABZ2MAB6_9BACT